MCRLLRGLVEGLPLTVSECRDAARALAMCAHWRPDWVVLDLNLAGMDPFALTRQMVTADRRVRVLLLGEEDDMRLRHLADRAGAWGYVLKQNLIEVPTLLTALPQERAEPQGK
jgi:CheY-like chemotaxis protein